MIPIWAKDRKVHGCWVWLLVNTKLKFDYDQNLDGKKQ